MGFTVKQNVEAKYIVELHYNVKNAAGETPADTDFIGVIKGNNYYKVVAITDYTAPAESSKSNGSATIANVMSEVGRFSIEFCIVVDDKYKKIAGTTCVVAEVNDYEEDDSVVTNTEIQKILE